MVAVTIKVVLLAAALLQAAGAQDLYEGSSCHHQAADRAGTCRRLASCPWARDQLRQGRHPQQCSFASSDPIVCCPESAAVASAPRAGGVASRMCEKYSEYVFQEEEPILLNDPEEPLLRDTCSFSAEPLIVGGEIAAPREFPHMALIGYGDEDNIQYLCGGSLIAPNFVMTAGHCLFTQSGQQARWVLLGDLDVSTSKENASPQRLEVAQAIKHPNYKPPQHYNDIALLRLEKNAKMTAYVRPACVYTEKTFPASRPKPLATGWGHTEFGGQPSSKMLKVALPLHPYRLCNESYRNNVDFKLPRGVLDDTQLCAGDLEGGKDTCQGDSGGPLQTFTGERPYYCMHHVLGVTSFGKGCGFRNSPAIYSRVSAFVPWIESVVWPNEQ